MNPIHKNAWLACVVAIAMAIGCGRQEEKGQPDGQAPAAKAAPSESAASAAKKPVIGVSLLTLANPFFKEMEEGIREEAAKRGFEVAITAGELDPAKQKNQISDFLVQKVAAIVLNPCDSNTIGESIIEANKAGVPVFTADIACLAAGAKVVTHVATDNYGGGREGAKAMIEALGGAGKIAIIDHPEVESVIQRTKGFEDELARARKDDGVTIEIVSKLPGSGAKDKSFKVAEDLLQAHPDLAGIFGINDPTALGAVAAIEKAGKGGKIVVIGFDGQPEARQAIKDGKIYADAMQDPRNIGRQTVAIIAQYMAGEEVPPQLLIPTALYKKADAEQDPTLK